MFGLFLLPNPFITGNRTGGIELPLAILSFCLTLLVLTAFAVWSMVRRSGRFPVPCLTVRPALRKVSPC
ncbi:MAG: hypothetical protein H7A46_22265 [Verrucomicrobiales bacterium]|nr:hypothetical protein [Verrucomicrobiales bacterium]